MKILTLTGILLAHLSLGAAPASAQYCSQAQELGGQFPNVVFKSGVALVVQDSYWGSFSGEVEVYERSPASGVFERRQILRADPVRPGEGHFGTKMDTDGDTIVVSSERMNFPGESSAVYIFEKGLDMQTWVQVAKIIPPASSASHTFGGDVAVSGDHIIVVAPDWSNPKAYAIDRDPMTGQWSLGQTISDPAFKRSGGDLDLDGDLFAIGERLALGYKGAVHTFERNPQTGMWTFAGSLLGHALPNDSLFGTSVAVQGNRVLGGAPGNSLDWGGALLWERDPVSNLWQLALHYTNTFGVYQGNAGVKVALDGDDAYIAIPGPGPGSIGGYITSFRYDPITSNWNPHGGFTPQSPPPGGPVASIGANGLGVSDGVVACTGSSFFYPYAIGLFFMSDSDQDCDGNGVTDTCEIQNGTGIDLDGNGLLDICEGIGSAYCQPTTLNSFLQEGQLSADGSLLASQNSLTLHATQLPPFQFGYALNSPYQGVVLNVGGSQGNLCIFGPYLGRHNRPGEVRYSGEAREFDLIVDLTNFPSPSGSIMVQAGETWNFQVWYRDQNPGNTSNLTNAVSLTFQ